MQPNEARPGRFLAWAGISCLIVSFWSCRPKPQAEQTRPNIIILLIDAIRADSLHDYGNPRNTNPFLAEFGRKGVRFANAHSHSSNTLPSIASLFTGLIPPATGVRKAAFGFKDEKIKSDQLALSETTIAEVLKKRKYSTAAFVSNPHLQQFSGLSQGFQEYRYFPGLKVRAAALNTALLDWLKTAPRKPFFAYVHYMDVHTPYRPPLKYRFLYSKNKGAPILSYGLWNGPISARSIEHTRAVYEAQINYWDDCFRALVGEMKKGGWLENTVFIILADHGEEFYDHGGFAHTFTLYEEVLHIPLYIVHAGHLPSGETRQDLVQVVDIFPTLGYFTGSDLSWLHLNGRSLFPEQQREGGSDRIHYAEVEPGSAPRSVQTLSAKLIFNSKPETYEFYDLLRDPKEQKNIYGQNPPLCEQLKSKLHQILSLYQSGPKRLAKELDQKTIELFKSLGYIK
jgi:arylsulfatase A-like enzyme